MGDPIINSQVDAINVTLGNIKVDLAALRPSIRAIKDAIAETYITDTIENVPIASFSDGADEIPLRELQVAINPIQSLNGQTSPYPAGGGKNKLNVKNDGGSVSSNGIGATFNSDGSVRLSGTATSEANITLLLNEDYVKAGSYILSISETEITGVRLIWGSNGTSGMAYAECKTSSNVTASADGTIGYHIIRVASGTTVNATIYPMLRFATETDPTFAPYSNICPISGHTEVNVVRTGKNIFGGEALADGVLASMSAATKDATNKTVSFAAYATTTQPISQVLVDSGYKFKENTRYTLFCTIFKESNTASNIRIIFTDDSTQDVPAVTSLNAKETKIVTTPANKTIDRIIKRNSGGTTVLYYEESGVFEGVLTASDFVPYLGQTYPISLGQTVYGGTLNVTTGVLTIDRGFATFDGSSDESWTVGSANAAIDISDMPSGSNMSGLSNMYVVGSSAGQLRLGNNNKKLYLVSIVSTQGITTLAQLQTFLSGNPLQVVYPLATPTTVQLTAAEVETLFGQNNVWADANGNIVKLTYRKAWEIALAEGE